MSDNPNYKVFSTVNLAAYLAGKSEVALRLGGSAADWQIKEVGDGNLNVVYIVNGPQASIIVKQALPYVRLVGDSWPLPLSRTFFEYQALKRLAQRDLQSVPEVFLFDK